MSTLPHKSRTQGPLVFHPIGIDVFLPGVKRPKREDYDCHLVLRFKTPRSFTAPKVFYAVKGSSNFTQFGILEVVQIHILVCFKKPCSPPLGIERMFCLKEQAVWPSEMLVSKCRVTRRMIRRIISNIERRMTIWTASVV
jgi:hypothetical protein